MYAIIEISGHQYRVEKDMTLKVPLQDKEVGGALEFDRVLLLDNGKKVSVGTPVVKGAKVSATVVDHGRDEKVVVFKKKRRKGYRVMNGHRQQFTKIQIKKIAAA